MKNKTVKIVYSGLIAGFVSEVFLGTVFTSPFIHEILYNPGLQSKVFIDVTPTRELFPSIAGIVLLSIAHSGFFTVFQKSIPGSSWVGKGLFWGFTIWLMYWVFQEWFIYHTLLMEPIILNLLELAILLAGSFIEGLIISRVLQGNR
jgi:hypothetical protein